MVVASHFVFHGTICAKIAKISITNNATLSWTTTVLSDKLDISLRPSKSTEQTQRDIANFSPLPCGLFRGFYKLKPKLVSVTN